MSHARRNRVAVLELRVQGLQDARLAYAQAWVDGRDKDAYVVEFTPAVLTAELRQLRAERDRLRAALRDVRKDAIETGRQPISVRRLDELLRRYKIDPEKL